MDNDQIIFSRSLELVHCIFNDNGERAHDIICDTISKGPDHIHDIFCCTTQIMSEFVAMAKTKNKHVKEVVTGFCKSMISSNDPQTCMDEYLDNSTMPKYAGAPYDRERDEEAIKKALERLSKKNPAEFDAAVRKLSDDDKEKIKRIKDKHYRQTKGGNTSDEEDGEWGK